jgi:hypothetical protein
MVIEDKSIEIRETETIRSHGDDAEEERVKIR